MLTRLTPTPTPYFIKYTQYNEQRQNTVMKAITQYKFETQNLKAAIANIHLWRKEYENHTKQYPKEQHYTSRVYDKLFNAYNILKSVEHFLRTPILKSKYQETFSKEKLLTEKILGL